MCGVCPNVVSAPGALVLLKPENTPLVLLLKQLAKLVTNARSPKSVASPVEAIVM